jgi:ATP-dependent Lhr-like helicase
VAEVRTRIGSAAAPDQPTDTNRPGDPAGDQTLAWLTAECGLDRAGAEQAVAYVAEARRVLGETPTLDTIVAERFFDEGGGMQLVIHAPFGGRINKAWGLALRKRFCRSFNFELQAAATDNGVNIALAEQHSFPLADVFRYLSTATVQEVLEQAALPSPIFGSRWRWDAGRSLALLRFQGGRKVPIQIQRMRADDLLASVFPEAAACQENIDGDISIPDHPLIREVMKDVLTEAMDVEGLKGVLDRIRDGTLRCVAVDTPVPSAFAHEILNANPYAYLDDAPLEERRARAVELRRVLPEAVLSEIGRLDQRAIEDVSRGAWPDVRDADDLHDALQTLVALPERVAETWSHHFDALAAERRAVRALDGSARYWVTAERARAFAVLFPSIRFETAPADLDLPESDRTETLSLMVQGWMSHIGPTTADELAGRTGLARSDVQTALLRLEAAGTVLRGQFRGGIVPSTPASAPTPTPPETGEPASGLEWCERRLLARIHRATLGSLRREIEPVTAADFVRWLTEWQHLAPGSQLAGDRGVLEALRQLQGFEAPASAWEPQLLSRRVLGYDPAVLDRLCLTGVVGWGRLSPHPATFDQLGAHHVLRARRRRLAHAQEGHHTRIRGGTQCQRSGGLRVSRAFWRFVLR